MRIPLAADPNSTVRCPRCQETFSLQVILEKAAPPLEVVDQPVVVTPDTPDLPEVEVGTYDPDSGRFEVPSIIQHNTKFKKRRRKEKEKHPRHDETWKKRSEVLAEKLNAELDDQLVGVDPATQIVESQSPVDSFSGPAISTETGQTQSGKGKPQSDSGSRREQEYERRRRKASSAKKKQTRSDSAAPAKRSKSKQPSPTFEFVKIVVGALLALPVAQLMIWWVVQSDPLGIGPEVSRTVPFVVPEKFRDQTSDATPNGSTPAGEEPSPGSNDASTSNA